MFFFSYYAGGETPAAIHSGASSIHHSLLSHGRLWSIGSALSYLQSLVPHDFKTNNLQEVETTLSLQSKVGYPRNNGQKMRQIKIQHKPNIIVSQESRKTYDEGLSTQSAFSTNGLVTLSVASAVGFIVELITCNFFTDVVSSELQYSIMKKYNTNDFLASSDMLTINNSSKLSTEVLTSYSQEALLQDCVCAENSDSTSQSLKSSDKLSYIEPLDFHNKAILNVLLVMLAYMVYYFGRLRNSSRDRECYIYVEGCTLCDNKQTDCNERLLLTSKQSPQLKEQYAREHGTVERSSLHAKIDCKVIRINLKGNMTSGNYLGTFIRFLNPSTCQQKILLACSSLQGIIGNITTGNLARVFSKLKGYQ